MTILWSSYDFSKIGPLANRHWWHGCCVSRRAQPFTWSADSSSTSLSSAMTNRSMVWCRVSCSQAPDSTARTCVRRRLSTSQHRWRGGCQSRVVRRTQGLSPAAPAEVPWFLGRENQDWEVFEDLIPLTLVLTGPSLMFQFYQSSWNDSFFAS